MGTEMQALSRGPGPALPSALLQLRPVHVYLPLALQVSPDTVCPSLEHDMDTALCPWVSEQPS